LPQNELDLGIGTAELVSSPLRQCVVDHGVKAQKNGFPPRGQHFIGSRDRSHNQ